MTRWLMPDREVADLVTDRPAEDGYVWINHPKLGLIQMPDVPSNLTAPEPEDGSVLYDPASDAIWQRQDSWPPEHKPECHWYSTGGAQDEFWPDVCIRAALASANGVRDWRRIEIPDLSADKEPAK